MTKLTPKTKPDLNQHTIRDTNHARRRLTKLSTMLEVTHTHSDLDITVIRRKVKRVEIIL